MAHYTGHADGDDGSDPDTSPDGLAGRKPRREEEHDLVVPAAPHPAAVPRRPAVRRVPSGGEANRVRDDREPPPGCAAEHRIAARIEAVGDDARVEDDREVTRIEHGHGPPSAGPQGQALGGDSDGKRARRDNRGDHRPTTVNVTVAV